MGAICSINHDKSEYYVEKPIDLLNYTVRLKHNQKYINFMKIWKQIMDTDMKYKSNNSEYKPIFNSQIDLWNRKVFDVKRKGKKMPY